MQTIEKSIEQFEISIFIHSNEYKIMLYSLLFCDDCSKQLAEEVMRSEPSPGEEELGGGAFEGMEALARAIELGKVLQS